MAESMVIMSRRNLFLIVGLAAGIVIALLLPSFNARAVASGLVVVVVLILVFRFSQNSSNQSAPDDDNERAQESPPETFALGKLFEATMSGMREGLLVVDKDMRVVASNAAAHQLFNLSKGKLNTQRLTELTRNPAIYSAFLDALQGSERSGVRIQTHGPERLVFDLRVVPLGHSPNPKDNDTNAEGALGVFVDITRIERLEQIRQEFLSNVSHELRTPLTAILAFVETLETGALEDKESSQRFLSIIRRNAVRMQDLIDDTLELSAIESGNVHLRAEQVELYPIVNDIVSSLAVRAADQRIEVANEVAQGATVYADARRLEQMLTNLVENAIKFNRAGGQVKIRCEGGEKTSESRPVNERKNRQIETDHRDLISVEDTGEGIPSQHLERLFERFYRVDRARSPEMGGTGLGLAIVKHLARAHGGEVTVRSELGKGSTFTIELPHYR